MHEKKLRRTLLKHSVFFFFLTVLPVDIHRFSGLKGDGHAWKIFDHVLKADNFCDSLSTLYIQLLPKRKQFASEEQFFPFIEDTYKGGSYIFEIAAALVSVSILLKRPAVYGSHYVY